jgi:hypothetical protein
MRQLLKALTSTTAWILVAVGCSGVFMPTVLRSAAGEEYWFWVAWGVAIVSLILAVVAVKLRQGLE